MITECIIIRIIIMKIQTNWLMAMGARECSLKTNNIIFQFLCIICLILGLEGL